MIQRIQTLWLFLASIANILLFVLPFYTATSGNTLKHAFSASLSIPTFLFTLLSIIIPFVAVFMFKNRRKQIKVCIAQLMANVLSLVSFLFFLISSISQNGMQAAKIGSGTFLILASLIFTLLALRGINNDEKLVKSSDRLR